MKFVLDESRKHQLIGFIVILSIAAILIPAMMKNPNENLDNSIKLSVKLPDKPKEPKVVEPSEKEMFQSVKVARVDLSNQFEQKPLKLAHDVKAQPISKKLPVQQAKPKFNDEKKIEISQAAADKSKAVVSKSVINKAKLVQNDVMIEKKAKPAAPAKNKPYYAVQLASFAVENNAINLVKQLTNKGYKATYKRSRAQSGLYRVIVGAVEQKKEAELIQKQLVNSIHLKGYVIKTGVS